KLLVVEGALRVLTQAVGGRVGHVLKLVCCHARCAPAWGTRLYRLAAPGDERTIAEALGALAVDEGRAVGAEHGTASGIQHSVAGGGVPLHRWAPARVDVRLACSDPAEFERRADGGLACDVALGEEGLGAVIKVRGGGDGGEAFRRVGARDQLA